MTSTKTRPVSPPDNLHKLTVGFELEFILIVPLSDIVGDAVLVGRQTVRETLSAYRFSKRCFKCGRDHTYKLPVSDLQTGNHLGDIYDPDKWVVDIDASVKLHEDGAHKLGNQYAVIGIEIKSRKLNFHGKTPLPSETAISDNGSDEFFFIYNDHHGGIAEHFWIEELKAVNDALRQLGQRPEYRVIVDESCGFHVHVGNDVAGVNVDVARKLTYIFTAFERLFDSINTTKRIGGGVPEKVYPSLPYGAVIGRARTYKYEGDMKYSIQEHAGRFSRPISTLHLIQSEKEGLPDNDVRRKEDVGTWLHRTQQCQTSGTLLELGCYPISIFHISVLDLARVWDQELWDSSIENQQHVSHMCLPKPTIEFRSHAGTLDLEEQRNWIHLVALLTEFCYRTPDQEVFAWACQNWSHYSYTFPDLLQHLDAPNTLIEYYSRVLGASQMVPPSETHAWYLRREEDLRNDKLKRTGIPYAIIERNRRHRASACVREKIRHKFHLGLYGKFPEAFVRDFFNGHDELAAHQKGESARLILRD